MSKLPKRPDVSATDTDTDVETIWHAMREQALAHAAQEPMLASFYHAGVIEHAGLGDALSHLLASSLGDRAVTPLVLGEIFDQLAAQDSSLASAAAADLAAYFDRDPACDSYCRPFLFYKGFVAIQAQRFASRLWAGGRRSLARYLQHRVSTLFDIDIHPAARLGKGLMVDHGTGLVIGETAVVGDNVSMLHGVTLGGTGTDASRRHPEVGDGVMLAAGSKLLGPIRIGAGCKVGAGSVVLASVPDHVTVVGVPARHVGKTRQSPSLTMDQRLDR